MSSAKNIQRQKIYKATSKKIKKRKATKSREEEVIDKVMSVLSGVEKSQLG